MLQLPPNRPAKFLPPQSRASNGRLSPLARVSLMKIMPTPILRIVFLSLVFGRCPSSQVAPRHRHCRPAPHSTDLLRGGLRAHVRKLAVCLCHLAANGPAARRGQPVTLQGVKREQQDGGLLASRASSVPDGARTVPGRRRRGRRRGGSVCVAVQLSASDERQRDKCTKRKDTVP